MYGYGWGKLVIYLNIDDIINTSIHLKEKKSVLLVYSFKNIHYQNLAFEDKLGSKAQYDNL